MRCPRPILLLAATIVAGGVLSARSATNRLFTTDPPPVIRVWDTSDGLPQNTVNAIVQSRDGYLWLGTSEGLVRFDGVRFTTFGLDADLPSVEVRVLLEDRVGTLWVATAGGGLGRWRNGRVESIDPSAQGVVSSLAEDADGRLWVGTHEGLLCFQKGRPVTMPGLELVANAPIRTLNCDANGTLWIGTSGLGLVAYREQRAAICQGPPGLEVIVPHCILIDRRGRLWISVGNWITLCRENEQWRIYGEADGLPFPYITSLTEDPNGTLWAGSLDVGLYRFDGTRFHAIREADGLSADDISALHADREGNLWAGTRTGGLNQLRQPRVRFIGPEQGLTNNYARSVAETADGTLWVATSGGSLYRGGLDQFERFRPGDPRVPYYAHVNTVLAASDGSLWWGGGNSLLQWHEGRMANAFTNQAWVNNRSITALCEDPRDGTIWIGNSNGELIRHNDGVITTFPRRIARGAVTAFALEPDGTLWMGSAGGGIQRIRPNSDVGFTLSRDLPSQTIRTLYFDAAGTLWIGTAGGGLSCWHQGQMKNFTASEGVTPRTVSQIVDDEQGFLWLGANRGVFKIRKQDLLDCAAGRLGFVHTRWFGVNDGMRTEGCSGGFSPAGLRTRSGLICISTVKGLVFLDPAEQRDETPPPRVLPEEVVVNGRIHTALPRMAQDTNGIAPRHLTIPPGGRELELHYTAIHFSAPEKLGFRYQLEGADAGWVEAGGRRTAYYQRLAPGDYTFKVQACNPEGVWGDSARVMTLTVLPFFWETAWFRAGVMLLAATALWWTLRRRYRTRLARLQMLHAIERERLRISKDMHDHVGGMLTQVSQLTDMTLSETGNPAVVTARLNRIGKRSRDAVQALDEIVWATNPKNDNLASFAEYISRFADEFFEYSGVRCWQEVPAALPALPLRADVRHNVFLAVREACNNVLKHSRATEVWIRLALDDGEVRLEVEDNGQGFNPDQAAPGGNGLENMRARLTEDGGRTLITSAPGRGTTVRFAFPLKT